MYYMKIELDNFMKKEISTIIIFTILIKIQLTTT